MSSASHPHRVLVTVGPRGAVEGDLEGASSFLVGDVEGDAVHWERFAVDATEARGVLAFIVAHGIQAVVTERAREDLRRDLGDRGVPVFQHGGISARAAAISAAAVLDAVLGPNGKDGGAANHAADADE